MRESLSGNSSLMRDMNRAGVLDSIRLQGPISQSEMVDILGLQPSTILRITKELEANGYIYQAGRAAVNHKGGRRAVLWDLHPPGAFAIGVDLGADEIVTVLVDLTGSVVDRVKRKCPSDSEPDTVLEEVKSTIRELLSKHLEIKDRLIGIGIAVPGLVDSDTGESIYAVNFTNWRRVPVATVLMEEFALPVLIDHDMRSMALGESWYGAGKGTTNLLCLGLRRGVGLGIVLNGEPYRGAFQFAGDVGHVSITTTEDGPLCSCGRRGCIEALASEGAILQRLLAHIRNNGMGSLNGLASNVDEVSAATIYEGLRTDSELILDLVRESGRHIGKLLCNLVRVFDPQKIIVGGGLVDASSHLLESVRKTYTVEQPRYVGCPPPIVSAELGDNSVAVGASLLILSKLFRSIPRYS